MQHNSGNIVDPKAETAIVAQAPYTTRVMFEDDESHLPEAEMTPLTDDEMLERARAEEDLRRRRDSARLKEERLEAEKKPTLISNPTWQTLPNETTKTYDVSAVKLVEEMNEGAENSAPAILAAVEAMVPTGSSAFDAALSSEVLESPFTAAEPSDELELAAGAATESEASSAIASGSSEPRDSSAFAAGPTSDSPRIMGQPLRTHSASPTPAAAKRAAKIKTKIKPKTKSAAATAASGDFAEWIHTYRLPIITFLMGIVVGVFIAFLV